MQNWSSWSDGYGGNDVEVKTAEDELVDGISGDLLGKYNAMKDAGEFDDEDEKNDFEPTAHEEEVSKGRLLASGAPLRSQT